MLTAAGMLCGAVEVAVPATTEALAGPLIGLWGLGALVGGIVTARRRGGGAQTPAGLAQVLADLAATHFALDAATGSLVALAAIVWWPARRRATCASAYALVDAPRRRHHHEAFAWLATALPSAPRPAPPSRAP